MPPVFLGLLQSVLWGLFLASGCILLDLGFSQAVAQSTSFKIMSFITSSCDRLGFLLIGSANLQRSLTWVHHASDLPSG